MLILEGELYINKHSVGPFRLYLALESATDENDVIKVVDLTKDEFVYVTGETVQEYIGSLDDEQMEIAKKYTDEEFKNSFH